MLRPTSPLFQSADESPDAGGSSPAPAPAPETAPVENKPAEEAQAVRPGVIAQATALIRGANGNAAVIAQLRADLAARDAAIAKQTETLSALHATIAEQAAELQQFHARTSELQSAITALEKKQVDVQTEVIHQLAAAGVNQEKLPQSTTPDKTAKVMSYDEFRQLPHAERNNFFRTGGKLTD